MRGYRGCWPVAKPVPIPFVPRPWQPAMLDHIAQHPRCAVWAAMGSGKTVATLAALQGLDLLDEGPALIIAPKRVAQQTWPKEAKKWSNLDVHVQALTGIDSMKLDQFNRNGGKGFFTTNYEQIPNIVRLFDPWPFKTIILDESTRCAGYRTRQGTKRMQLLAKVAWLPQVKRLIQLTGTPAPNGIKNVWGQLWFLDQGQRLGKTYNAFSSRWFAPSWDGYGIVPFKHSQGEIQDRISDLCITIDPRDYMDVSEPIETIIEVELPHEARKLYREMERAMFFELSADGVDLEVEAFGAASRINKCIAEGTEILTNRGWLPIEQYQDGDLLWDGIDWVNCYGLVCQGYKSVVDCRGVSMTADHRVLTTEGWREAQEILDGDASGRPYRTDIRLPDSAASRGQHYRGFQESALEMPLRMRQRDAADWHQLAAVESRSEEVLRLQARRDAPRCMGDTRHDRPSGVGDVGKYEVALSKPEGQGLSQLRSARDTGVRAVAAFRQLLGRHAEHLSRWLDDRANGQQPRLLAEELPLAITNSAEQQSSQQRDDRHADRQNHSGASGASLRLQSDHTSQENREGLDGRTTTATSVKKVYDLVDCGPRHRFTVRNHDGCAFVVHNCLQIANGFCYYGEESNWAPLHEAKLDALESIVEESNGMPLLVSYQFKTDLLMLKKRFAKGRTLDEVTEDEWNEGKVPMLFVHPKSAGHGLNLQWGSNILVDYSSGWDLESDLQVIERIGPMRQFQAGLDRAVYRYRLVALNTVDEMVAERRSTKASVQDILLSAMKRYKPRR